MFLPHKSNRGDNIKTGLKEIRSEGADWLHLAKDRDFVYTVMNFQVP